MTEVPLAQENPLIHSFLEALSACVIKRRIGHDRNCLYVCSIRQKDKLPPQCHRTLCPYLGAAEMRRLSRSHLFNDALKSPQSENSPAALYCNDSCNLGLGGRSLFTDQFENESARVLCCNFTSKLHSSLKGVRSPKLHPTH